MAKMEVMMEALMVTVEEEKEDPHVDDRLIFIDEFLINLNLLSFILLQNLLISKYCLRKNFIIIYQDFQFSASHFFQSFLIKFLHQKMTFFFLYVPHLNTFPIFSIDFKREIYIFS